MKKRIFSRIIVFIIIFSLSASILDISIAYASPYLNLYKSNSYLSSSYFIDDTTYCNTYDEQIKITNEPASNWYNDNFHSIYKSKWILNPKSPITLADFLRLIFDMQISAEPKKSYPKREIEYEDIDDYFCLVNMIEILSGTGTWNNPSILNGTPTETGLKLNLNNYITRAQAAKIIDIACSDWYKIEKSRTSPTFTDINNNWAKENIKNAYEYGFVNGKTDNEFKPDEYLSIEEGISILYNIMNSYNLYSINDFVSAVNCSDIVKITEVYTADFIGTPATKPLKTEYYYNEYDNGFNLRTGYNLPSQNSIKYLDNTLYAFYDRNSGISISDTIYSFLSGRIGPIQIIPPDSPGIQLYSNGSIEFNSSMQAGEYTFTIINEYGNTEYLKLHFYTNPKDMPINKERVEKGLLFTTSNTFFLNLNESIDLNECFYNISGKLHIYCENPKYTTFDGISKITLVKKPPAINEYNTDYDKIYISDDYKSVPLYIKGNIN